LLRQAAAKENGIGIVNDGSVIERASAAVTRVNAVRAHITASCARNIALHRAHQRASLTRCLAHIASAHAHRALRVAQYQKAHGCSCAVRARVRCAQRIRGA
jgi:hypothetical protein